MNSYEFICFISSLVVLFIVCIFIFIYFLKKVHLENIELELKHSEDLKKIEFDYKNSHNDCSFFRRGFLND